MAVLSLADAKAHLNVTTDQYDAELDSMIESAEDAIAKRCGPLTSVATTERVEGCSASLALNSTPVVSLTSVTPVLGSALTLADLYLDTAAGVVSFNSNAGYFTAWKYDVVYQAGRASVPDDLLLAIKEMVKHLWDTQRGGSNRPGARGSDSYSNTLPGVAGAFPSRVEQLIAPHVQIGFA